MLVTANTAIAVGTVMSRCPIGRSTYLHTHDTAADEVTIRRTCAGRSLPAGGSLDAVGLRGASVDSRRRGTAGLACGQLALRRVLGRPGPRLAVTAVDAHADVERIKARRACGRGGSSG
jgi:hypothetical protein